jgi:hypothetical protein
MATATDITVGAAPIQAFKLGWRPVYWGSGLILAGLSLLGPNPVTISPTFLGLCALLVALWMFGTFLFWLATERPSKPLQEIAVRFPGAASSQLDRAALFLSIPLFWSCFAPLKAAIPAVGGFWADPYLAAADNLIFLGHDPWTLTHALFGDVATQVIDAIYASWVPLILLTGFLVAMRGSEQGRARFYVGWGLIWLILGVGAAFALSSAGPIFGPRLGFGFETLQAKLQAIHHTDPLLAVSVSDTLWLNYQQGNSTVGNGISAAPSLHCAIAFFLALLVRRTRYFPLATIYAAIIWVGSVHLGWHYFLDGLLSLVGVLMLWPIIVHLAGKGAPDAPNFLVPAPGSGREAR